MQRLIKFRQFVDGEFWYWGYGVDKGSEEFVPPKYPDKPSQQYTGWSDRNGIKIYGGDALRAGKGQLATIVEWSKFSAGWITEPIDTYCGAINL